MHNTVLGHTIMEVKMGTAANLGRIFGIRLKLHYTWLVALLLITATIVTQFPEAYPLWQRIVLGIAASLLFFASVGIRELVVSFVALSKGVPLRSLTLFVFGGVSQIAREATFPILELLMAVTGLLSTLIIAGVFSGVHLILAGAGSIIIAGLLQWLAFINFMLFLFHFIPGFPLDGGRILRTILWRATGNYDRATRTVCWSGRGIGLLFIVGGILVLILAHQWFVGLLLAFMGWVLQSAAAQSRRQAVPREVLQGITARDIMTGEGPLINPQLSLGQLVRDYVLVTGRRYFIVVEEVGLQGMVTMRDIKKIPKERWDSTRIGKVMTPRSELKTAHPQKSAASLLEQMDELGISQIPVLEKDKVIGIVTRDSLNYLVKTRTKLRM